MDRESRRGETIIILANKEDQPLSGSENAVSSSSEIGGGGVCKTVPLKCTVEQTPVIGGTVPVIVRRRRRRLNRGLLRNHPLSLQRHLMATSKRVAKRSIIGTRVCVRREDGMYHSGYISAIHSPTDTSEGQQRFSVTFDHVPSAYRPLTEHDFNMVEDFTQKEIYGPGFNRPTDIVLPHGQRVFLTYNGREVEAIVLSHVPQLDEVEVILPNPIASMQPTRLTKRMDELRLVQSRKSARLALSVTDFARLADMGGDRKRASSYSIDVPYPNGSRKRRPSSGADQDHNANNRTSPVCIMDECSAAIVLMSLSNTPPERNFNLHCQKYYSGQARENEKQNHRLSLGSPGVSGTSNSSSSTASWPSRTPSPMVDDDISYPRANDQNDLNGRNTYEFFHHHVEDHQFSDLHLIDQPRKRRMRLRDDIDDDSMGGSPNSFGSPNNSNSPSCSSINNSDSPNSCMNDPEADENYNKHVILYKCIWRESPYSSHRCGEVSTEWRAMVKHVLHAHLGGDEKYEAEADFYIDEEIREVTCSPPTKSHWDMVRPRTEDPEYQRQQHCPLNQQQQHHHHHQQQQQQQQPHHEQHNPLMVVDTPTIENGIVESVPLSPSQNTQNRTFKQFKASPRPALMDGTRINLLTVSIGKMPNSPRRVRGETKKCRKVYGMEHKELWCTQCKWKKACSRFHD